MADIKLAQCAQVTLKRLEYYIYIYIHMNVTTYICECPMSARVWISDIIYTLLDGADIQNKHHHIHICRHVVERREWVSI